MYEKSFFTRRIANTLVLCIMGFWKLALDFYNQSMQSNKCYNTTWYNLSFDDLIKGRIHVICSLTFNFQ